MGNRNKFQPPRIIGLWIALATASLAGCQTSDVSNITEVESEPVRTVPVSGEFSRNNMGRSSGLDTTLSSFSSGNFGN